MGESPAIITVTLNPAIDRIIEVDGLVIGSHQMGREALRTAAGKGVNVSTVLAALGVPSLATGFLGEETRTFFETQLAGRGIAEEFVTIPGRTRENITLADSRTKQETHIRDVGLAVDWKGIDRLGEKLRCLAKPGVIIIFSGSLPPGVAPGDFANLVTACMARGARVAVDTQGPALGAIVGMPLWLIKPNAQELSQLAGRELRNERQRLDAARLLARGMANVLLTCGSDGAFLLAEGRTLHGIAPLAPKDIRSTVGCGDVMLGAYVAGLWRGLDVRHAFTEAVACSAACAMTFAPAAFDPAAVDACRLNVRITERDSA